MKQNKLYMCEAEWRLALYALNELRTTLIADGRYTDVVDEVIMKIIAAPVKRMRVVG